MVTYGTTTPSDSVTVMAFGPTTVSRSTAEVGVSRAADIDLHEPYG